MTISGVRPGELVHLDGQAGDRSRRAPVADQRRRRGPCARARATAGRTPPTRWGSRCSRAAPAGCRRSHTRSTCGAQRSRLVIAAPPRAGRSSRSASAIIASHELARPAPARRCAPTPWPHGMNSFGHVDLGAVGCAEVVDAGLRRGDRLLRERLQLLGVLLEVVGPVVAHDPARLAGERPADDRAVLGEWRAASPCSR